MKTRIASLEIRKEAFPFVSQVEAVKMSEAEALNFDEAKYNSFDELVGELGRSSVLHTDEFYDGYIAIKTSIGRIEIVRMRGQIQRVTSAKGVWDPNMAQKIREGKVWQCVYLYKDEVLDGLFNYVWTFRGMQLQRWVNDLQRIGHCRKVNPAEADKVIKDKLCAAVVEDKTFELTKDEDFILKTYLGNYYDEFFLK